VPGLGNQGKKNYLAFDSIFIQNNFFRFVVVEILPKWRVEAEGIFFLYFFLDEKFSRKFTAGIFTSG
jgi:hypothetical protein